MVNDSLSDFITQIRNGYMAGMSEIVTSSTKSKSAVAKVLVKEEYVEDAKEHEGKLILTLKYKRKKPAIEGLRRISKPGVRIYTKVKNMPRVWGGLGINIVSTPKGVMSDKQAKKLHLGGELIAQVW